jgi:hypothetical protein
MRYALHLSLVIHDVAAGGRPSVPTDAWCLFPVWIAHTISTPMIEFV